MQNVTRSLIKLDATGYIGRTPSVKKARARAARTCTHMAGGGAAPGRKRPASVRPVRGGWHVGLYVRRWRRRRTAAGLGSCWSLGGSQRRTSPARPAVMAPSLLQQQPLLCVMWLGSVCHRDHGKLDKRFPGPVCVCQSSF